MRSKSQTFVRIGDTREAGDYLILIVLLGYKMFFALFGILIITALVITRE